MNNKASKSDAEDRKESSILVAVCDEDFALVLAQFVEQHNWSEHIRIHVLYVVEEPLIRRVLRFSPDFAQKIIDENDVFGHRLTRDIKVRLSKAMPNAKVEASVRRGIAKDAILRQAALVGANYIVLGSHGRLGLSSVLLGSVSLAVMMEAGCSVLVIRHPAVQVADKAGSIGSSEDLPKQMVSHSDG